MEIHQFIIAFIAACAAGFTNAIAGGGTLITFPVLTAIGLPSISANISNTIALCPGYIGGVYSQRKDFGSQRKHLYTILPITIFGGIIGGIILLNTKEQSFRTLVPYLILFATLLLLAQNPIKNWINNQTSDKKQNNIKRYGMMLVLFLTAVYGGYFGAGISVIVFAVLSLVINDTSTRINVLKQIISFSINATAAIYFSFSNQVVWPIVFVMIIGSILGGFLGGKVAGAIKPHVLKFIVIIIGFSVSIIYFVKI